MRTHIGELEGIISELFSIQRVENRKINMGWRANLTTTLLGMSFIFALFSGCSKKIPIEPSVGDLSPQLRSGSDTTYWEDSTISGIIPFEDGMVTGTCLQYYENGDLFSVSGRYRDREYYRVVFDTMGRQMVSWGSPIFWEDPKSVAQIGEKVVINFQSVDFPNCDEKFSTLEVGDSLQTIAEHFHKPSTGRHVLGYRQQMVSGEMHFGIRYGYRTEPLGPWRIDEEIYVVRVTGGI